MATHYALTRPPLALSPETVLVIDLCPQANASMAGNGKRERGKKKRKVESGKRKEERGKRKEGRGKRKTERGKMKEQAEKS